MSFQFQEIPSHIVDIYERVFFVDVVLSYIDVEVIETVLIKSRLLTSRSHVTGHCI